VSWVTTLQPYFGGGYNHVAGKIKELTGKKKTLYTISGKWDEQIFIKPAETKARLSSLLMLPRLFSSGCTSLLTTAFSSNRRTSFFGIPRMRHPRSPWTSGRSISRTSQSREGTLPLPNSLLPAQGSRLMGVSMD
jgi:hypothetical protein